ncbi:hypothetical protein MHBO_002758 [Bonamia ostreae]|uniref:acylphosphatase n=1 Tax=Bonamia ostreae TaxID=126728 RepID=A0ABV2AND6_9EUKA
MCLHIHFRVFGKVQKVFFRKSTVEKARSLEIVGYVRNLKDGSVQGEAFGKENEISIFKNWLENEGSPDSKIERVCYEFCRKVDGKYKFDQFYLRKINGQGQIRDIVV